MKTAPDFILFRVQEPSQILFPIALLGNPGAVWAGATCKPCQPNGKRRTDMTLNRQVTVERLDDRMGLLASFAATP